MAVARALLHWPSKLSLGPDRIHPKGTETGGSGSWGAAGSGPDQPAGVNGWPAAWLSPVFLATWILVVGDGCFARLRLAAPWPLGFRWPAGNRALLPGPGREAALRCCPPRQRQPDRSSTSGKAGKPPDSQPQRSRRPGG